MVVETSTVMELMVEGENYKQGEEILSNLTTGLSAFCCFLYCRYCRYWCC